MSKLYDVLGVPSDAPEKEVTKAFRAKARRLHPDKQPPGASDADKQRACKAFQELVGAYEILSDEAKRRRHDLQHAAASPPAAPPRQPPRPPNQEPPAASAGGRREREAGRAPPRTSARGRRYAAEEEAEEAERPWRPPRKTPREEEDDKDARRRREQQERDKLFEGLGAHWVKPPPQASAGPRRSSDVPFTQARSKPMPKTKVRQASPPRGKKSKKKRSQRSGSDEGEIEGSDCSSDASSVLSFGIRIDLKKYNFIFEPNEDDFDTLDNTEVWIIKQPAATGKEIWTPLGPTAERETKDIAQEKDAPAKSEHTAAPTKRCCVVQ